MKSRRRAASIQVKVVNSAFTYSLASYYREEISSTLQDSHSMAPYHTAHAHPAYIGKAIS